MDNTFGAHTLGDFNGNEDEVYIIGHSGPRMDALADAVASPGETYTGKNIADFLLELHLPVSFPGNIKFLACTSGIGPGSLLDGFVAAGVFGQAHACGYTEPLRIGRMEQHKQTALSAANLGRARDFRRWICQGGPPCVKHAQGVPAAANP